MLARSLQYLHNACVISLAIFSFWSGTIVSSPLLKGGDLVAVVISESVGGNLVLDFHGVGGGGGDGDGCISFRTSILLVGRGLGGLGD